jgi:hypothetical protein
LAKQLTLFVVRFTSGLTNNVYGYDIAETSSDCRHIVIKGKSNSALASIGRVVETLQNARYGEV